MSDSSNDTVDLGFFVQRADFERPPDKANALGTDVDTDLDIDDQTIEDIPPLSAQPDDPDDQTIEDLKDTIPAPTDKPDEAKTTDSSPKPEELSGPDAGPTPVAQSPTSAKRSADKSPKSAKRSASKPAKPSASKPAKVAKSSASKPARRAKKQLNHRVDVAVIEALRSWSAESGLKYDSALFGALENHGEEVVKTLVAQEKARAEFELAPPKRTVRVEQLNIQVNTNLEARFMAVVESAGVSQAVVFQTLLTEFLKDQGRL